MSAVAELLNQEWDLTGKQRVNCNRINIEESMKEGILTSHNANTLNKGTVVELLEILFVDDGAFIFNSRDDLCAGIDLIIKTFARFGLQVHIGKGESMSKTECIFFPAPGRGRFKIEKPLPLPPLQIHQNHTLLPETHQQSTPDESSIVPIPKANKKAPNKASTDKAYDECWETQRIILSDGSYADFTKEFTYLGSVISYDLDDSADINKRILKASQSIGALSNLWKSPFVDLKIKHSFFLAIPINLLLWGCEAWALKEASLKKLDSFMHKAIRRILGINMQQVHDERIKNEDVRKRFFTLQTV